MAKNNKLQLKLADPVVLYMRHLQRTGLYGNTLEEVALHLVRAGIMQAIANGLIKPQNN